MSKKLKENRVLDKILASILILCLTLVNSILVASYLTNGIISYAAGGELENQELKIANGGMEFDAYYLDQNGRKTHSFVSDVNAQTKLYLYTKINNGYLKDASIEFRDAHKGTKTNFELAETEGAESIQKIDKEKQIINLKQLNQGNEVILEIPIKANFGETIEKDQLSQTNKMILKGTYINNQGKESTIEKEIDTNLTYTSDQDITLSNEITKYLPFTIGSNKGVILQNTLKLSQNRENQNKVMPIKNTELVITVPKMNEIAPNKVEVYTNSLLATNGEKDQTITFNEKNWTYDSQTGEIRIQVENTEKDGKIYAGTGEDVYYVTYTYPEAAYQERGTNIITKVSAKVNRFQGQDEISKEQHIDAEISLKEKIGNTVTGNIQSEQAEINKGKLYANYQSNQKIYETEFSQKVMMNISNKELIEGTILVANQEEAYHDQDPMGKLNTYYKESIFSKENLEKVLGLEGSITIRDKESKEVIGFIDKNTVANEKGKVVVTYTSNPKEIEIETSKPQENGEIAFSNKKAITLDEKSTKEQIKEITSLKANIETQVKYIESTAFEVTDTKEVAIPMTETTTNTDLVINKTELSSVVENKDVELKLVLNNDKEQSDLYTNPKFRIEFPSQIEDVTIKSANLVFGDELQIESITKEIVEGKIILNINTIGVQTRFSDGNLTNGTNINILADIRVKKLTPNMEESIKLNYTNDNVVLYTQAEKTMPIKFVAPTEMVNIAEISGIENIGAVDTMDGEKAVKIGILDPEKTVTMKNTVINNNPNSCSNVELIGRIPAKDNKKITTDESLGSNFDLTLKTPIQVQGAEKAEIYYSTNENADKDLNKASNLWMKEPEDLSKVKSYLVLSNQVMEASTSMEVSYDLTVPANLEHNYSTFGTTAVYYNNNKEEAIVPEIKETKKLGLTTGEGPRLQLEKSVNVGDKAEINERQRIKYTLKLTNNGAEDAKNVVLKDSIPEGTTYTVYEGGGGNGANEYKEYPDQKEVIFEIGTLKAGESIEKEFEVISNAFTNKEQSELKISNTATVTAEDLEKAISSNTIENTIKKSDFSTEVVVATPDYIYQRGEELIYNLQVTNISNKDIEGTTIEVAIPEGTTYKESNLYLSKVEKPINPGDYDKDNRGIQYDENHKKVNCQVGTLLQGAIVKFQLILDINKDTNLKTIQYNALVKGEGTKDYSVTNNQVQVGEAKLSIQKSSTTPKNILEGDIIDYTITIKNEGEIAIMETTIEDLLPEELELVNGYQYDNGVMQYENTFATDIKFTASIWPGKDLVLKFKAKAKELPEGVKQKEIANKALVKGEDGKNIESNEVIHIIEKKGGEEPDPDDPTAKHSISGTAWLDENRNGQRDSHEPLMSGIVVELMDANTKEFIKDENGAIRKITTDDNGKYSLSDIPKGKYIAVFEYDTKEYGLTDYKKTGVSEEMNSDVVEGKINQDGMERTVAITDTIDLNRTSQSDVNIGLIRSSKFDLKLDKTVSKVTVQNKQGVKTYEFNDSKLAKVDIKAKYVQGTTVFIEFKVKITNEGDTPGYAKKLIDYMPQGTTSSSEINSNWYTGKDNNLYSTSLENEIINPGETKEITLVISKKMTGENTGMITNTAEIYEDYNEAGIKDLDSTPGNRAQNEDDISTASALITIDTGQGILYFMVFLIAAMVLGIGIYLFRVRMIKKEQDKE